MCSCIICTIKSRASTPQTSCGCAICIVGLSNGFPSMYMAPPPTALVESAAVSAPQEVKPATRIVTSGQLCADPSIIPLGWMVTLVATPSSLHPDVLDALALRGLAIGVKCTIVEIRPHTIIVKVDHEELVLGDPGWCFEIEAIERADLLSLEEAVVECGKGLVVECVRDDSAASNVGNFYRMRNGQFECCGNLTKYSTWVIAYFPNYGNKAVRHYRIANPPS